MTSHEEEEQLDQFWRDVSAEMISDTITLEEADRRMAAAEEDELSDDRIDEMVRRATTRRSSLRAVEPPLPAAPRGRIQGFGGWRMPAGLAASTVFSALLLSAGIAVMLWPEGNYSTTTMRFDTASRIATDPDRIRKDRVSALSKLGIGVALAVNALNEIAAGGGEHGKTAEEVLLGLRISVSRPDDLEFEYTTAPSIETLVREAKSGGASQREQKMRELEREATYALSSIWRSGERNSDVDSRVQSYLASISRLLGL